METEVEVRSGMLLKRSQDSVIIKHTSMSNQDNHILEVEAMGIPNQLLTLLASHQAHRRIALITSTKSNLNGGMTVMEVALRNGTPSKRCKHLLKILMNSMNKLDSLGSPVQTIKIKNLHQSINIMKQNRFTQTTVGRGRASTESNYMTRNTYTKWQKILEIIIMAMDSCKQKQIPNGGITEMEVQVRNGMPLKKLLGSAITKHTSKSKPDNHGYLVLTLVTPNRLNILMDLQKVDSLQD